MIGNDAAIVRHDGENRPIRIDTVTGVVDRPNSQYLARLSGDVAWRLFASVVGIAHGSEITRLIRACNRVARRKTLATDDERRNAVWVYAGVAKGQSKAAKPHGRLCRCPRCLALHLAAGCRRINCRVCFG